MYTRINFKSKKALKEAVAASRAGNGELVEVYQPGPFGPDVPDGEAAVEGPHYPKPHSWYCRVRVVDGAIIQVLD